MDLSQDKLVIVSKRKLEHALKEAKTVRHEVEDVCDEAKKELSEIDLLKIDAENWRELERKLMSGETALVNRKDFERLTTEAMQIKEYLPKVLKKDFYEAYGKLDKIESALNKVKTEKQKISGELERAQKKHQNTMSELEEERKEKAEMKNAVEELSEINSQQSEYCSRMGAATCTLLWRLSQNEECIETILAGTHTEEFLQLVCHTVESFSLTLSENDLYDEESREVKFVLALCGVATNIAASPYGRDFVMGNENGQKLVNSMLFTTSKLSPDKKLEMKIRNLCLKFLYNISINQKGVKYLTKRPSLLQKITSIVEADINMENRVLSVRLIQSLMLESNNASLCHTVLEMFPIEKMRSIAVNANGELQEALLELINDVKFFSREK